MRIIQSCVSFRRTESKPTFIMPKSVTVSLRLINAQNSNLQLSILPSHIYPFLTPKSLVYPSVKTSASQMVNPGPESYQENSGNIWHF